MASPTRVAAITSRYARLPGHTVPKNLIFGHKASLAPDQKVKWVKRDRPTFAGHKALCGNARIVSELRQLPSFQWITATWQLLDFLCKFYGIFYRAAKDSMWLAGA